MCLGHIILLLQSYDGSFTRKTFASTHESTRTMISTESGVENLGRKMIIIIYESRAERHRRGYGATAGSVPLEKRRNQQDGISFCTSGVFHLLLFLFLFCYCLDACSKKKQHRRHTHIVYPMARLSGTSTLYRRESGEKAEKRFVAKNRRQQRNNSKILVSLLQLVRG